MSSVLYLKKLAKMLEINSFVVFKGKLVFWIIEQAELNRAFLQDMVSWAEPSQAFWKTWRAEPSFFAQKLEPKPSQAKPSFGSDPTLERTHK